MNKIEEVLRKNTMNLFNDNWYIKTCKDVLKIKDESLGYVYFVKSKRDESIKIGYSVNLTKRLSGLKTGFSDGLYLIGYIYCNDFQKKEKEIHSGLMDKRVVGEWFGIDLSEAASLISKNNGVIVNGYFNTSSYVVDGLHGGFDNYNEKYKDVFYKDLFNMFDEYVNLNTTYDKDDLSKNVRALKKEYSELSERMITQRLIEWSKINGYRHFRKASNSVNKFKVVKY